MTSRSTYQATTEMQEILLGTTPECPLAPWTGTMMPMLEYVPLGATVPGGTRIAFTAIWTGGTTTQALTLQKLVGVMGSFGGTFKALIFIP